MYNYNNKNNYQESYINVEELKNLLDTLKFTGDNKITISGNEDKTNFSINLSDRKNNHCSVSVNTDKFCVDNSITVDYKTFINYVNLLNNQEKNSNNENLLELLIDTSEELNRLYIGYKNSCLSLNEKQNNFEDVKLIPDNFYLNNVSKTELAKNLTNLLKYTDKKASAIPVITNVNLKLKDNLITLASIDGFRLYKVDYEGVAINNSNLDVNINQLTIKTVAKIIKSLKKLNIFYFGSDNNINQFRIEGTDKSNNKVNIIVQSKNDNSTFFDYNSIIDDPEIYVELDKKKFVDFLRLTQKLEKKENTVILDINSELISVSTFDENNNLKMDFEPISYKNVNNCSNYRIGFNNCYLLDGITGINGKTINIGFDKNNVGPIQIDEDNKKALILPIRISD